MNDNDAPVTLADQRFLHRRRPDQIMGRRRCLPGGFWGLLFAPAVFFLPGPGLVAMAGPFVSALVGVLEGAVLIGGVSALGAALIQIGVPKEQVVKYENAPTVDTMS